MGSPPQGAKGRKDWHTCQKTYGPDSLLCISATRYADAIRVRNGEHLDILQNGELNLCVTQSPFQHVKPGAIAIARIARAWAAQNSRPTLYGLRDVEPRLSDAAVKLLDDPAEKAVLVRARTALVHTASSMHQAGMLDSALCPYCPAQAQTPEHVHYECTHHTAVARREALKREPA